MHHHRSMLEATPGWGKIGPVPGVDLATLVVAYDDVDIALSDYADLRNEAAKRGREKDYEAAVMQRHDDGYELVTSSVQPRERETVLGAGLGFVLGVLVSPALPAVIVGAGIGAVIGNVMDQIDAFRHTDLQEVRGLIDDSAATLMVISDEASIDELRESAMWRHRRVVVPLLEANVDVLKREIQQVHPSFGV
jgi:uncharacterized membrane protein